MDQSIFKSIDIRGIYPTQVNEEGAARIGRACSKLFVGGTIVIAHDTRHGSETLAKAVTENIVGDFKVIFVGLSTTPMYYFLVNELKASGGCMVTASHNPKNYNGFKIVGPGAESIAGTKIRDIIASL